MADTPKPMQGIWTLIAPNGRTWQAESPLRCAASEQRERIPATVALERILKAADETPDPLYDALRKIADMDPAGRRADDLGRAARIASAAIATSLTVVYGSPAPHPPCTVCGKPYAEHGSYPTCASHPFTADGTCQHVLGASCVGAECRNGCVRGRAALSAVPPTVKE